MLFGKGDSVNHYHLAFCHKISALTATRARLAVKQSLRRGSRSCCLALLSVVVPTLGVLTPLAADAQTVIDYPSGFAGVTSGSAPIWLENASTLSGSSIQLTALNGHSANNIWYKTPVNVQAFTTTFSWTATCPASGPCGDGMGFMIISDPNSTPAGFTYSGYSGGQFSWSQCQFSNGKVKLSIPQFHSGKV